MPLSALFNDQRVCKLGSESVICAEIEDMVPNPRTMLNYVSLLTADDALELNTN
jgi:hypothetical protein